MSNANASTLRQPALSGKAKNQPKTLEDDRGAYVLDVIRAAGRDIEATLKKIAGNTQAAKVLRWALYWSGKSSLGLGDTFYKTRPQWEDEAGISESNLKTAVKHLRKFSWWRDEAHLQPNGRRAQHYTVDVEAVYEAVMAVLKPRQPSRLRLVEPSSDVMESAPEVEQIYEVNPVESTGLNLSPDAGLMRSNQPDSSGETNRVNPVESTVCSLHAFETSINTPTQDSHSAQAGAREALPAPAQGAEREIDGCVGVIEKGEAEKSVSELADFLIAIQLELLGSITPKDPAAALDLARYAVNSQTPLLELEMVCREKMNELSLAGRNYCGLFAAASRIGAELNCRRIERVNSRCVATSIEPDDAPASARVIVIETEEQRLERETEESLFAEAEQARRKHEQQQVTMQAKDEARQRQVESERIAGLIAQLEQVSVGRIKGADTEREQKAMRNLVHSFSIEFLRDAFEWHSANLRPGEPLCWDTVDFGMARYKQHLKHPHSDAKKTAWRSAADLLDRMANSVGA
jgi:hypothetical protein